MSNGPRRSIAPTTTPKSRTKSAAKAAPKAVPRGAWNEPDSEELDNEFDRIFGSSPEPERPHAEGGRGSGGEAASGSGGPGVTGPMIRRESATIHHRVVYVPACTPEEFETMRQRIKYIGREVESLGVMMQDLVQDRQRQRTEARQQWGIWRIVNRSCQSVVTCHSGSYVSHMFSFPCLHAVVCRTWAWT